MIKFNFSHFTVIRFLFFLFFFSPSVFTRTTTCFHSRWNTNRCVILLYDSFRFSFPPAFAALQKVFGFCVFSCSLLSVFVFPLSSGLFWFWFCFVFLLLLVCVGHVSHVMQSWCHGLSFPFTLLYRLSVAQSSPSSSLLSKHSLSVLFLRERWGWEYLKIISMLFL